RAQYQPEVARQRVAVDHHLKTVVQPVDPRQEGQVVETELRIVPEEGGHLDPAAGLGPDLQPMVPPAPDLHTGQSGANPLHRPGQLSRQVLQGVVGAGGLLLLRSPGPTGRPLLLAVLPSGALRRCLLRLKFLLFVGHVVSAPYLAKSLSRAGWRGLEGPA